MKGLDAGPPSNADADRCTAPHQVLKHWKIQLLKQEKLPLCLQVTNDTATETLATRRRLLVDQVRCCATL